jgi:hypothetical protein
MLGMSLMRVMDGMTRVLGVRGPDLNPLPSSTFMFAGQLGGKSGEVYNILWALVFGFATLNILSLVTRRFEPNRNRMSPGELMAVATVVVSVLLLSFEMLGLFHVLPLRVRLH